MTLRMMVGEGEAAEDGIINLEVSDLNAGAKSAAQDLDMILCCLLRWALEVVVLMVFLSILTEPEGEEPKGL